MFRSTFVAFCCAFLGTATYAYSDTNPLTFSVYADSDYPRCCGVILGSVYVDSEYFDTSTRGMAEFKLNQPYRGEVVNLSFTYSGSYTRYSYPGYYQGSVGIVAYVGDYIAARPDFSVASFASVGGFLPSAHMAGDILTFDVTSIFQLASQSGDPALGFRFTGTPSYNYQSASFGNFSLATTPPVPEPSQALLLLVGLTSIGAVYRKRRV